LSAQASPKAPLPDYGWRHAKNRAEWHKIVLAGGVRCVRCGEVIEPDEPWDLGHVDGDPSRYQGPEHRRCNRATSGRRPWAPPKVELSAERDGLTADDERWRVPWLEPLLAVPRNATWPRLMTVPHPDAVGSLGDEFVAWAEERSGRSLRWWQRLVAARLLEHNGAGELVWTCLVLSMARQLGKSWLLRELLLWRVHQGERFGEPQDVLHTGKDLAICKDVQRPARMWAKARPDDYKVREVNGQEEIERLADGSRWLIRAKEAVYGYPASVGAADEGWKVRATSIEEGLTPTMVERVQPQLLLVSTAHRLATSLMLNRRQVALEQLETGAGDLLVEWSAPRDASLEDRHAWRQASPFWSPQREQLLSARLAAIRAGESVDPEEPNPEESFRAQWLNQWPRERTIPAGAVQDLFQPGQWAGLAERGVESDGPVYVAIEDDFGLGAAVACAAVLDDGRIEVDGWLRDEWDSAIADVRVLALRRELAELHVGASLVDRMPTEGLPEPRPAVASGVRHGLALLRDLVANGVLVHDATTAELDAALTQAQVRESLTGLYLIASGPTHLVRALAWAVRAAHRPAKVPAIH